MAKRRKLLIILRVWRDTVMEDLHLCQVLLPAIDCRDRRLAVSSAVRTAAQDVQSRPVITIVVEVAEHGLRLFSQLVEFFLVGVCCRARSWVAPLPEIIEDFVARRIIRCLKHRVAFYVQDDEINFSEELL